MKKALNEYFDHTLLKPDAGRAEIERLCAEAVEYGFYSVCVNSCQVETAAAALAGTSVKVACVAGFPLGASLCDIKAGEASMAAAAGASEIDMVINVGAMKDGRYDEVRDEIAEVVECAGEYDAEVKVILETCLLTDREIVKACQLAEEAGAAFVKTSTGFSSGGATVHHVKLMKDTVGDRMQVKASGGIRDLKTVLELIEAGADRIGASASVSIMKEAEK